MGRKMASANRCSHNNLNKIKEEYDRDFSPDDLLGTLIGNY